MKLGVFSPIFDDLGLEGMLDEVGRLGLDALEIATGGYPGSRHCDAREAAGDARLRTALARGLDQRGLQLSALSCHGNPLHPQRAIAEADDALFRDTVRLAAALGVRVVNVFSGCPGDQSGGAVPNWVVCRWPTEFADLLAWQWEAVVLPYWREAASFAADHGVRVAVEMHPGFVVYNPETALWLREEVGENVGVNFDPSHLFWQGIDPVLAVKDLGEAIFHVHAKDTFLEPHNIARNGVLDRTPANALDKRSWFFRSVGDGHDQLFWSQLVGALQLAGYDHVVSIEHEDPLASRQQGLSRAIDVLRRSVPKTAPANSPQESM